MVPKTGIWIKSLAVSGKSSVGFVISLWSTFLSKRDYDISIKFKHSRLYGRR
jgi:hypothetical protein